MSKKAKTYTAQEKAKVAMEAIRGDLTMAQLSSLAFMQLKLIGGNVTPLRQWLRVLQPNPKL